MSVKWPFQCHNYLNGQSIEIILTGFKAVLYSKVTDLRADGV